MPAEQIADSVTAGGGRVSFSGNVAQRLLAGGFRAEVLRTNATLRKDEWIQYDKAIIDIARSRLVGVGDLMSKGLRYPVADALGVTRVEWENVSDMTPAEVSMSGVMESDNDRVVYDLEGMPLPIIHKDFNINVRVLHASRKTGQPLDTTQAQVASRKVAELIETMLFNGATVLGSNRPIYGYTTAPNRNTGSVTASWVTATGAQIIADILAMIGKAVTDNMYGPYVLYVPAAAYTHMADDYKAESDRTILERVLAIPGITAVRPTKDLAAPNVVMVQMTSDVVDMIDGMGPTMVEWDSHGGFVAHFKVFAIMAPRIRNDQLLQSGIVHYS
jgi:uncharacterized linocin/CFP29 family protein